MGSCWAGRVAQVMEMGSCKDLSFPSSYDYRSEPPVPGLVLFIIMDILKSVKWSFKKKKKKQTLILWTQKFSFLNFSFIFLVGLGSGFHTCKAGILPSKFFLSLAKFYFLKFSFVP
jgi:hypothetical protein